VFKGFARILLYISVFMATAGIGTYATIHLLIGSGHRIVVPDLTGKDVVYALEVLSDLGLNTKVKGLQFDPAVPKHHIISQSPDPGSELKAGRDVRLVISKGVRWVVYPNVVGMELSMADLIIEENDLVRSHLSHAHSQTYPEGQILSQYPVAGTRGVRRDAIDLLISSGPRPQWLRMMDLSGMKLDEAIDTIERYQLTVGTIKQVDNPTFTVDTVVAQSPERGYPVLPGSSVDLTIHRASPRGSGVQRQNATLFRYRVAQGFLRQNIRVRINRADAAMIIYDRFVKPGEAVWLLIPRDAPTALFLYVDDDLRLTKHFD
jgi:eukaryotic-like serine/threonine-protein kinase